MQDDQVEDLPGPFIPKPQDGRATVRTFLEVLDTPTEALRSLADDIEASDDLGCRPTRSSSCWT
jgi:hypothetical protein